VVLDWVPEGLGTSTKAYAQPKFPLRVCIAAGFVSLKVASAIFVVHWGRELERQAIRP
jgi:hypothetical protein